jgi:DNA-binding response OmpR family regulator
MKILLVEDDPDLVDLLTYALRRHGYTVVAAVDGEQALARPATDEPDLVLLDVKLPKLNGFEVCRRLRQRAPTPIILLTARDEEADILRGFQAGADDYVTKPFSTKQLAARMQAVLRRYRQEPQREAPRQLRAGDLVLDLQAHQVTIADKLVQLTRLEFRILHLLALNEGQVLPYSRLVEYIWGYPSEGHPTLLKTHVTHIRQKLQWATSGGRGQGRITAVPGVGYRLARSAPTPAPTPPA